MSSKTESGEDILLRIVPELMPGVNGRKTITGRFSIYKIDKNEGGPLRGSSEFLRGDQDDICVGELCFLNEAFFEWKYEGDNLSENELHKIVEHIQNNIENELKQIDEIPATEFSDKLVGKNTSVAPARWLDDLDEDALLKMSPYFHYGDAQDLIAIVKNGDLYDILLNDHLIAKICLSETNQWQTVAGEIKENELFEEVTGRIEFINKL